VATWPVTAVSSDGRSVSVAEALGPGGDRVATLLARVAARARSAPLLEEAVRNTPAGPLDLPVRVVSLAEGVQRAGHVDPAWLAAVEERRSTPRPALAAAGRTTELNAALNLAMLLATGPVDGGDGAARVASGARLWLLGAGVAWALLAAERDPFAPWTDLVSVGIWPVGPVGARLVVVAPDGSG
jgi:hypothetical protein